MNEKNRNLALRVGSALLLFPLLVWATWMGGLAFTVVLVCAAAISAHELIGMFTVVEGPEWFAVAVAALLPFAPYWAAHHQGHVYPPEIPVLLAVLAMALLIVNMFRRGALEEAPRRAAISALAWIYCGLLVATVNGVRQRFGFAWVILAFVITWMNDICAYFAGRFFGKHPLYPRVSPKKTWEGFAGGVAGSVLGALVARAIFLAVPLPGDESFALSWAGCVGVGLGASALGPVGDLVESMFKRAAGVKDSGKLIPGHGGILDRIDALLFVGPWVYLWASLISRQGS